MEVTLKNFKCWKQKRIELSPSGITLLSGPSGAGKSSLLEAIYFTITGKGRGLIYQGARGCEVKIILNNGLSITRSKRPNVLKVKIPGGKIYEDDAAEGYLETYFTRHYDTIGFLGQGGNNKSFVLMGPTDKLAFIEDLAFQNVNIANLKFKTRELMKEDSQNLQRAVSRTELITQQIEAFEPIKTARFPIKTKDRRQSEDKVSSTLKKCQQALLKTETRLERITSEEKKCEVLQAQLKLIKKQVIDLTEVETRLNEILEKTPENLDENLKIVLRKLRTIRKHKKSVALKREIKKTSEKVEHLKNVETSDLKSNIKLIKCWTKESREEVEKTIRDIKEEISRQTRSINLSRKLRSLKYNSKELTKLLDELTEKQTSQEKLKENLRMAKQAENIINCPLCAGKLKFHKDHLEPAESLEKPEKSIKQIRKELIQNEQQCTELSTRIDRLKSKKNRHEDLKNELSELPSPDENELETKENKLNELTEYLSENILSEKKLERLKSKLRNNEFSRAVQELEKNLQKDIKKLSKLEICEELPDDDEDYLQDNRTELEKQITTRDSQLQQLDDNTEKLNEILEKLERVERKLPEKSLETIKTNLQKGQAEKLKLKDKIERSVVLIKKINDYNVYKKEKDRQNKIKKSLDEETTHEKIIKKESGGSALLFEKIKEAESICLNTFMENIQAEVQMYLDEFFTKDPLSLNLKTIKETKTKKKRKPEIHITLDYKGRECDPTSLSGGELQRLILAFTLAFTERFNLPVLLLDECTSNLDQELTSEVVTVIKKYQHSRPVLLVAHQVVSGMFDKVITI